MVTTINLANIRHHTELHESLLLVVRAFKMLALRNLQMRDTVSSAVAALLRLTPQDALTLPGCRRLPVTATPVTRSPHPPPLTPVTRSPQPPPHASGNRQFVYRYP